jgi:hypothetical protein
LKESGKQIYLGEGIAWPASMILHRRVSLTNVAHYSGGFEKEEFAAEARLTAALSACNARSRAAAGF